MTDIVQVKGTFRPDMAFIDKKGNRYVWWAGMNHVVDADGKPAHQYASESDLLEMIEAEGWKKKPHPAGKGVCSVDFE